MISSLFRALPAFRGKQRLARLLLKKTIASGKNLVVDGKYECSYHLPNTRETIGFEIFINGIYEEDTILFIKERISSRKVIIDIGANIGAISIPLKKICPDVSIICVEAAPWIFDFLRDNIRRNDVTDIVAINKAIAAEANQEVEFFSPQEKFGKGSMAPVFTDSGVKVETMTFDSLASDLTPSDIGLIKIDVEGFESHAFKGGAVLLNGPNSPDILFEFVDWAESAAGAQPGDAQRVLMSYGYKIHVFRHKSLSPPIKEVLMQGSVLLYATKNNLN